MCVTRPFLKASEGTPDLHNSLSLYILPSSLDSPEATPQVTHCPFLPRKTLQAQPRAVARRGECRPGAQATTCGILEVGKKKGIRKLFCWVPRVQSSHQTPGCHSRCSKQQFRRVPTAPPLRTEESVYWVRGSSRWITHLLEDDAYCCPCSRPLPHAPSRPRRRLGFTCPGPGEKHAPPPAG